VIATNLKLAMNILTSFSYVHSLGFPSPAHFRYGRGERAYWQIARSIPHFGSSPLETEGMP